VAHRMHETLSPESAQHNENRVSDFSALDNVDYQDTTSDPQAVSPSQWSSIAMHRG
jgi:hypothetical protein